MKRYNYWILPLTLMLCGCAYNKPIEKEQELKNSIQADFNTYQQNDADHRVYESLSEQLDSDGYYFDADSVQDSNQIQVSFAENSHLSFEYYYDQQHTKKIDLAKPCYIKRGESVFAYNPQYKSEDSQDYIFIRFDVYSIDSQARTPLKQQATSEDDPLSIRLPETRTIQAVSIVPMGEYQRNTIKLEAYCIDAQGHKSKMNGTWKCDEKIITGETYEIQAPSVFRFTYEYDSDQYYEIYSETKQLKSKSGKIVFDNINVQTDKLTVVCKPYVTASIAHDDENAITEIKVNNITKDRNAPRLEKLIAGQTIMIRTSPDYRIKCDELSNDDIPFIKNSNGYEFSCIVPDDNSNLHFYSAKWANKTIAIDVDSTIIDRLRNFILKILKKKPEDELIKIRVGEDEYNYTKLKSTKEITVNESQNICLIVDPNLSSQENIAYEISINGQNPVYVYKNNTEVPKLSFGGTSKIAISVKKGFVFSYQNIDNDNGNLQIEYSLVRDHTALKENQFLPEGEEIEVRIKNADQYTVVGGAIEAGASFGTITIKDSTNISDFAVQYERKE